MSNKYLSLIIFSHYESLAVRFPAPSHRETELSEK